MSNFLEDWRQEEIRGDLAEIHMLQKHAAIFQMLQPEVKLLNKKFYVIYRSQNDSNCYVEGMGETMAKAVADFYNNYYNRKH